MHSEFIKYIPTKDAVNVVKTTLKLIDPRLVDHGERVAFLLLNILRMRHYPENYEKKIFLLGVFHDIGAYKTEEIDDMVHFETANVMDHSIYGYLFLKYFTPLSEYSEALLYHHTAYSVTESRKDDLNIRAANIIHLTDRIDLLCHKYSDEELYAYLNEHKGVFDPFQVDVFIELNKKMKLTDAIKDGSYIDYINDYLEVMDLSQQDIENFISMLVYTIDFRSAFTVTHSINTQVISIELAERLGKFDEGTLAKIYYGAFLHDIGKITTPLHILESPNRLTFEEMEIMKEHAVWTKKILSGILDEEVKNLAGHHHEKLDGSGYPEKLTEAELTKSERIIAVADVISALTGVRSYKTAFPKEKIISILQKESDDGKLDPEICALAVSQYDDIMKNANEAADELLKIYNNMQAEFEKLSKK